MSERLRFHEGSRNAQSQTPQQYPYPPNYQYPPPPEYAAYFKKDEVRRGFFLIFIALILTLISDLFRLIIIALGGWYSLFYEYGSSFVFLFILSGLGGAFWFLFIVLTIIGIVLLYQSREIFGKKHAKFMKIVMIFLITYFILFVIRIISTTILAFSFLLFEREAYSAILGITTFLSLLSSFVLILIFYLPTRELSAGRERDEMYIFAILAIVGMILLNVWYTFAGVFSTENNYSSMLIVDGLFNLFLMVAWGFAAHVYYKLWKFSKLYGTELPIETKRLLPRPEPIANYLNRFFNKPKKAIIILAVVALVLGATQGAAYASLRFGDNDSIYPMGPSDDDYGDTYIPDPMSLSEYLNEGDSIEFYYYVNENVDEVFATLTWTDEDATFPRENEPDGFTLEINLGDESETMSAENDGVGNGQIELRRDVGGSLSGSDGLVSVTITMDYAGDQKGPAGLTNSPLTVADRGNLYSLEIWCQ